MKCTLCFGILKLVVLLFTSFSLILTGGTPTIADVFRLYCSLVAGLTVSDLCVRNDISSMAVNER